MLGSGAVLVVALGCYFARHRNWLAVGLSGVGAAAIFRIAWLVFTHDSITKMTQGILLTFEVTPQIIGVGVGVAAGLGILACIGPALAVARMSVVNGLKTLD